MRKLVFVSMLVLGLGCFHSTSSFADDDPGYGFCLDTVNYVYRQALSNCSDGEAACVVQKANDALATHQHQDTNDCETALQKCNQDAKNLLDQDLASCRSAYPDEAAAASQTDAGVKEMSAPSQLPTLIDAGTPAY